MKVTLAYGRTGLTVEVPDSARVVTSRFVPGVPDEPAAIRHALRHPIGSEPLARKVKRGDRVVVVHTDITRATPNRRLLPVLLAELEAAGVRRGDVTLLNGLGTHRPQTDPELRRMLGDAVVDGYRCVQHNAFDGSGLLSLGETSAGHPIRLNRVFLEADVRILTGFIEPHFFAGFSGGPKGVVPALAGAETVFTNHGRDLIGHPAATWGRTAGNPIWEEMREVAERANPSFLLNVAMNARGQITGVFGGDMLAAHAAGCRFVADAALVPVDEEFDIVLTTNSGYPLDQNLYQCVKGLSAAARVVRDGGTILLAAECRDGLPDHGGYAALLAEAGSPRGVLDAIASPGFSRHDQWQVQIQAMIQLRADVWVYSGGLSDAQIRRALFRPCGDVAAAIRELTSRCGPRARVGVLPEGPMTIPCGPRDRT